jgi:TolA-binding protein
VRDWLAGLPPAFRWSLLGAAGLLAVLAVASGVWGYLGQREASARRAFTLASTTYRQAMAAPDEASLEGAAKALAQFVADYPRSAPAGQAWYDLGNVEYRRRRYDAALTAFGEAARRTGGTVAALSRLGMGYAWEAKEDSGRALETYTAALKGRTPSDFVYVDLMLATARAQEQLKQPAAAIKTYRQLLQDSPGTSRAEEVRTRLAILGAGA